jgi:hypothetical protein
MTDTTDNIYFHYTVRESLASILKEGLLPFPVTCWREDWCERCDGDGVMSLAGFPPEFPVVWLTKLAAVDPYKRTQDPRIKNVRIKIELSPSRKLVHLPRWLKRNAPATYAKLDEDVLFTGWLKHYWYKGIITPDKFRGIDTITAEEGPRRSIDSIKRRSLAQRAGKSKDGRDLWRLTEAGKRAVPLLPLGSNDDEE